MSGTFFTIEEPKRFLTPYPAPGQVHVIDIGAPRVLLANYC
jgi:hypothetical protein